MPVVDAVKCRCEVPQPTGPFVCGMRKCKKCGKVANWRKFEN